MMRAPQDRDGVRRVPLAAPCLRTRRAPRWRAASIAALYTLSTSLAAVAPAAAEGLPLIRDTEIESLLKDYSRPIFKAAGIGSQQISMRVVCHESFNAFVVDGRNVFVNTGTLTQAKTPNEVIGVIAHETGHITGGHMAALRSRIARDQSKSLLIAILGIGLLVGGAMAGGDTAREVGGAGGGLLLGGNEVLMRSLLSERRAQESAADQAGLRYLEATRQSGRGMLKTFENFAQQEYVSATYQDPFVRSHPVAADRLAQLRDNVAKSPFADAKDPPQLQLRHDMMRAKVYGYLESHSVPNLYRLGDNSLPARYARAIARNCSGRCGRPLQCNANAMADFDGLISERPQDPYVWEAKGSILLRAGRAKEAIAPLRKATQLLGDSAPLVQAEFAQALISLNDDSVLDEAVSLLRKSIMTDGENAIAYHQLGLAYYRKGLLPQAELAAAQGHFLEGNVKQAQVFAKRALTKLPRGSPEWIRAEDIVNYKAPT